MEEENFKVLVVSHNAFSKIYNNGKTLESIFLDIPKENIAQIFFSQNEYPDYEFCNNYFKITDKDVLKNIFYPKKFGAILDVKTDDKIQKIEEQISTRSKIWKLLKSISSHIVILRDYLWKFNSWNTKKLSQWIDSFNPSIVFYYGGNAGFSHDIAIHIKKKYKLPLAVFFSDDYLINPIDRNFIDKLHKRRMRYFFANTVDNASVCFAIGDLMAAEYSDYFGKQFYPIMNSIDIKPYVYKQNLSNVITIRYFGGLHLKRWKMISRLGKVIKEINENTVENRIKFILEVYSTTKLNHTIIDSFNENCVDFKGSINGSELEKKMTDSDILLHVESDDEYYRSLTKLSVSTKIPEYLISGRCVVAYGPSEVASIRILSDNHIGYVISSEDIFEDIKIKLLKILQSPSLRISLGQKGYDYAVKVFNAEAIRKNFMLRLKNVINNH